MKIPAIRASIGDWVYYSTTLTFEQIANKVKKIDNELHASKALSDLLQRSISDNYLSIAQYLNQQEERFFNSLVLAVYDGDPKWHEIRLDYGEDEEYLGVGLLELNGEEKIFPVDGQHRVEGIKKALEINSELKNEQVSVLFLGHKTTSDGMKRSRRLFSTLNRYAKPVSMRDIIALDEDDVIAICTREMVENYSLFQGDRILDIKNKAIPSSNTNAITTIITLYECNRLIAKKVIQSEKVYDYEGNRITSKKRIEDQFLRVRPAEQRINDYCNYINLFWNGLIDNIENIKDFNSSEYKEEFYRNSNGGDLLFRPLGLLAFVKATTEIAITKEEALENVISKYKDYDFDLGSDLWKRILWNDVSKTMIMSNKTLVYRLFIYAVERQIEAGINDELFYHFNLAKQQILTGTTIYNH